MTGEGICCSVKHHNKIDGADFIVSSSIFGQIVILNKESNPVGIRGLLFDTESELSDLVCKKLNLYRHNNLNEDKSKTGYIEDNRRIRNIKLKGVKCDGLFLSFDQLETIKELKGISSTKDGIQLTEYNNIQLSKKYVRPVKNSGNANKQIKKVQTILNFAEHCDTDQLLRNLSNINIGDTLIVTSKVHGTSSRCGLLPTTPKGKFKTWWHNFWNKKNDYRFVVGSRHTVKHIEGQECDKKDSFYDQDVWTESAYKYFHGKLLKGETVYYEIVGFLPNGTPIMPTHDNKKLEKFLDKTEYKEFIKKFGNQTVFHYGCRQFEEKEYPKDSEIIYSSVPKGEYKIFVYRITLTTEHGQAIDLSWDQVKRRCDELGVNHVPEIEQYHVGKNEMTMTEIFHNENFWLNQTEQDDPNFPTHLNEGIVVRIENGSLRPKIYKSKRYNFKVLEGIVKDTQDFADLEESN